MAERLIAHSIHHTHWDPYWWFAPQEAMVTFAYNLREMLEAFRSGEIDQFFLDGQTTAIFEYLQLHPSERDEVAKWVSNGKLAIGPFVNQLDAYLSSGESIINNARLGINYAESLGGSNRVAYHADPFGFPADFPKILAQLGVKEFVFTRGVGDVYGLGTEFYFESNDGSRVLCNVLLSGYGYGANAFRNGDLFTDAAEDYNKIDVGQLIDRLVERSTLENEFVFPLGFDSNPIMRDVKGKIRRYNEMQDRIEFRETTWPAFFDRVREHGKDLKTHTGDIFSPQYHRIHVNGMNSARSDIKTLIDQVDRKLVFELQPLMSMMAIAGIPYDHGIIDQAWYHLVNTQTHGSATHGDMTNAWVKSNAEYASYIVRGASDFLCRLTCNSVEDAGDPGSTLVLFHTLPWRRRLVQRMSIITSGPSFRLELDGRTLPFVVESHQRHYLGVQRKDPALMTEDKWYHRTEIVCDLGDFDGIGYRTARVIETGEGVMQINPATAATMIENEHLRVSCTVDGIDILDKHTGQVLENALYFEDGGDEGDSYDYDYPAPEHEWIVARRLTSTDLVETFRSELLSELRLAGELTVPAGQDQRRAKLADAVLPFTINLTLNAASTVLRVSGSVVNRAHDHRLRLGIKTGKQNTVSFGGGPFSIPQRPCLPPEMAIWQEKGYFEEPSATRPLLNHVSAVDDAGVVTIYTRSLKEYEFVGEGYGDVMLTVLRAVGYIGLPDLHRRPGRPSGMAERLFTSPTHQLDDIDIQIDIGIGFGVALDSSVIDQNAIFRTYAEFATNPLYSQNQKLDPLFYPISYFPINPWSVGLPRELSVFTIDDPGVSFGTVVESDRDESTLIRLFNASADEVLVGTPRLAAGRRVLGATDLIDENRAPGEDIGARFAPGQLTTLVIGKREEV
jgi:mannosylglycerate hydrolase